MNRRVIKKISLNVDRSKGVGAEQQRYALPSQNDTVSDMAGRAVRSIHELAGEIGVALLEKGK